MAIEWLELWGVAGATGFVFRPILEELAKDAAKKMGGDYVKACFGSVFKALHRDPLQKAVGQTLKELLQLLQDELLDCDVEEEALQAWIPSVKAFVHQADFKQAIGDAIEKTDTPLDGAALAQAWAALESQRAVPEGFSWDRIAKRVCRKIKDIRTNDPKLREVFDSQTLGDIAEATKQIAGVQPGFNLVT